MIGNRLIVAGAVATAALLALPVSAQSTQKVGVIEVQRIVQESAVGKESLARIQKIQSAKQDDLGEAPERASRPREADPGPGQVALRRGDGEAPEGLPGEGAGPEALPGRRPAGARGAPAQGARRARAEGPARDRGGLQGARLHARLQQVPERPALRGPGRRHHRRGDPEVQHRHRGRPEDRREAGPGGPAPKAPAPAPRSNGRMALLPAATTASDAGRRLRRSARRRRCRASSRGCGRSRRPALATSRSPRTRRPRAAAVVSAAGVLLARSASSRFRAGPSSRSQDPSAALAAVLERVFPRRTARPGIHPTAIVAPGAARRPPRPRSGPYAVVGEGAEVADGAILEAHVVVGRRCRIANDAWLHPHVVLYDDVAVGPRAEVHSGRGPRRRRVRVRPRPDRAPEDSPGRGSRDRRRRRDRREHLRRSGHPRDDARRRRDQGRRPRHDRPQLRRRASRRPLRAGRARGIDDGRGPDRPRGAGRRRVAT